MPVVQYFLNHRTSRWTESRPFESFFAQPLVPPGSYREVTSQKLNEEDLKDRLDYMSEVVFPSLRQKVEVYNNKMEKAFNKKKQITEFAPGDMVYVKNDTAVDKLEESALGPFKVLRRTKGGTYILQDSRGEPLDEGFPPSKLTKVPQDVQGLHRMEDDKHYKVENILDHQIGENGNEYLVR